MLTKGKIKVDLVLYHLPQVGDRYFRSMFWFMKWNHSSVKLTVGKEVVYVHGWFNNGKPPYWINQRLENRLFLVKRKEITIGFSDKDIEDIFSYIKTLGSLPKSPIFINTIIVLSGIWFLPQTTCSSICRDILNFIFDKKLTHSISPEGLATELHKKKIPWN